MVACRATRTIVITPTWIETFQELHSATTAPELWGVLVSWHGIRSSSVWEEPFILFTRFHRDDATDAIVTAALLCTDHRWGKASHHLIHHICDSGLLAAPQIDELAEWFLLETFEIAIMLGPDPSDVELPAPRHAPGGRSAPQIGMQEGSATSTVRRPLWPPLRRWAARHLMQRSPLRWRELFELAEALPSRDGAAIAAGVIDGADHIPAPDLPAAVALGLASGSGIVRLAALPLLATLEGVDAALARARSDASAKVRAWTPRTASDLSPPANASRSTASGAPEDDLDQLSFF
jgi:hypothetical protein